MKSNSSYKASFLGAILRSRKAPRLAALPPSAFAQPQQSWVISPAWDLATIIASPLIWMLCFGLLLPYSGLDALIAFFLIFNVGHHIPTFLRIYGDRDLLRRFRWNLLFAPIIPFCLIFAGVCYININGYSLGPLFILYIFLILWDPWHFLMQDYGFMRIYDRHNPASRSLASWMDFTLCMTWFIFAMVGAVNWLPETLYELYCSLGIPLLFLFDGAIYRILERLSLGAALLATLAYLVYLGRCYARGYWISPVKLLFFVIAFGTLYLAYVPNGVMKRLVPAWDFTLGFAAIGMVHVTQYLAIVWKYNRSLASRSGEPAGKNMAMRDAGAARPGLFRNAFGRGGAWVLIAYVMVCAGYGFVLVKTGMNQKGPNWLVGLAVAIGFTSTMMHYYYDGFIWKFRHKENQQYLYLNEAQTNAPGKSWWDTFRRRTVLATAARHALYFGLPLILMGFAIVWVHRQPLRNPSGHIQRIITLRDQGKIEESIHEARIVVAAMDAQLSVERKMNDIRPTAGHFAYAADLLYWKAYLKAKVIEQDNPGRRDEMRREIAEAVQTLERALTLPGRLAHRGDKEMTLEGANERLARWRAEAGADLSTFKVLPLVNDSL